MLTKVEVLTAQGTTLVLPLQDTTTGFIVKNIDGLDPVKSTIVFSKFAQLEGSKRQSSSRENRNLVFHLGFAPDYVDNDIRSLRSYLYDYLMPKSVVTMRFFMDDILFVEIVGEVESCEAPMFAKEPTVDVSVVCFDPDFRAPVSVPVDGNTTSTGTEQVLMYPGSSETGFEFQLRVNRTLTTFTFYNRIRTGEIFSMEFVGALQAGDILDISTIPGAKGCWLTRTGVQNSILYAISPAATWFALFPGANNIRVAASGADIPFTIEYLAKYGGL